MKRIGIPIFISLFFAAAAWAEDDVEIRSPEPGQSPPKASVASLSWLAGYWEGPGLDGLVSDFVSPPVDGQIMGAFRHVKADGALNFYEFYTIAEVDGALLLRIRLFYPDFTARDEKDEFEEFALVAVEDDAVYFDGFTLAMTGPDQRQTAVQTASGEVLRIHYRRLY